MPTTRSKFNRDVDRIMDLEQWMRQSKLLTEQRDAAQRELEAEKQTVAQLRHEIDQLTKEVGGGNQQLVSGIDQLKQENARLSDLTEQQRVSLDETLASLTLVSDELEKLPAVHESERQKQRAAFEAELRKQKEDFLADLAKQKEDFQAKLAEQKRDAAQAEKDMDRLAEDLMASQDQANQVAAEKNIVKNVHVVELIANNQQIDTAVLGGQRPEDVVTFINSMAYTAEQEMRVQLNHDFILHRAKEAVFNPVINQHNVIVHGGNWAIIHRWVEVYD